MGAGLQLTDGLVGLFRLVTTLDLLVDLGNTVETGETTSQR